VNRVGGAQRKLAFESSVFVVTSLFAQISTKMSPKPEDKVMAATNCTIFLGYTSNMVSCGVRETIRFLVKHRMVRCFVELE